MRFPREPSTGVTEGGRWWEAQRSGPHSLAAVPTEHVVGDGVSNLSQYQQTADLENKEILLGDIEHHDCTHARRVKQRKVIISEAKRENVSDMPKR